MKCLKYLSSAACAAMVVTANGQSGRTIISGDRREIVVNVNGEQIPSDLAAPKMVDGRVLIPLRGVLEKLGAAIEWHPEQKVLVVSKGDRTATLGIGATYGTVNGRMMPLAVPAQISHGRTMVPLRYIAEALGAYVLWDEIRRVVVITTRIDQQPSDDGTPPYGATVSGHK